MNRLGVKLYTVFFIFKGSQILLLKRALWKKYGAGKITGIGGRIEGSEVDDILSSAFRELEEETRIKRTDLSNVKYLGVLSFSEPAGGHGEGHTYFFSASLRRAEVPLECNEGDLRWYAKKNVARLDFWEDTKAAMPLLFEAEKKGKIFRGIYLFGRKRNNFIYVFE